MFRNQQEYENFEAIIIRKDQILEINVDSMNYGVPERGFFTGELCHSIIPRTR